MSKTIQWTTDDKVTWYTSEDDINDKIASVLGERFVEYRKAWDAVSNFETLTEFPLYLQVELNQICNLKCPMCPLTIPESREKYITDKHISWEMYEKIILEAEKYNCPSLNPQGVNEPLLDQNLEDYIKFAKKHGFIDIMMNTNATLLSEERSKKLIDSGITRLRFSLDAVNAETFKKVRVGSPPLDKIKKNIYKFLELKEKGGYKLPITGVSFVNIKQNEKEKEKFINEWKDVVDIVTIQKFAPPSFEKKFEKYYPKDQYVEEPVDFNCVQPFHRVVIRNNDITPCCAVYSSELKIGDLRFNSIYDAWHSKEMKKLRALHKKGEYYKNDTCKKCVNSMYPLMKKNYTE